MRDIPKVPFGYTSEDEDESNFGHGKPMTPKQLELYRKVREKRKENDDLSVADTNQEFPEHELIETTIYDREKDREGKIESIYRRWYDGWYWTFLTRFGKSHGLVFGFNESSEQESIENGAKEFQERYEIKCDGEFEKVMLRYIDE